MSQIFDLPANKTLTVSQQSKAKKKPDKKSETEIQSKDGRRSIGSPHRPKIIDNHRNAPRFIQPAIYEISSDSRQRKDPKTETEQTLQNLSPAQETPAKRNLAVNPVSGQKKTLAKEKVLLTIDHQAKTFKPSLKRSSDQLKEKRVGTTLSKTKPVSKNLLTIDHQTRLKKSRTTIFLDKKKAHSEKKEDPLEKKEPVLKESLKTKAKKEAYLPKGVTPTSSQTDILSRISRWKKLDKIAPAKEPLQPKEVSQQTIRKTQPEPISQPKPIENLAESINNPQTKQENQATTIPVAPPWQNLSPTTNLDSTSVVANQGGQPNLANPPNSLGNQNSNFPVWPNNLAKESVELPPVEAAPPSETKIENDNHSSIGSSLEQKPISGENRSSSLSTKKEVEAAIKMGHISIPESDFGERPFSTRTITEIPSGIASVTGDHNQNLVFDEGFSKNKMPPKAIGPVRDYLGDLGRAGPRFSRLGLNLIGLILLLVSIAVLLLLLPRIRGFFSGFFIPSEQTILAEVLDNTLSEPGLGYNSILKTANFDYLEFREAEITTNVVSRQLKNEAEISQKSQVQLSLRSFDEGRNKFDLNLTKVITPNNNRYLSIEDLTIAENKISPELGAVLLDPGQKFNDDGQVETIILPILNELEQNYSHQLYNLIWPVANISDPLIREAIIDHIVENKIYVLFGCQQQEKEPEMVCEARLKPDRLAGLYKEIYNTQLKKEKMPTAYQIVEEHHQLFPQKFSLTINTETKHLVNLKTNIPNKKDPAIGNPLEIYYRSINNPQIGLPQEAVGLSEYRQKIIQFEESAAFLARPETDDS